jgi:hypothetical protein
MVTVVVSVVLLLVGLVLVYYQAQAVDLIRSAGLPSDIQRQIVALIEEKLVAYAFLAASPLLLIAGSLVRGL